ncbi:aminodeoxychorismate lyase [Acinetobacter gerneri]|uniref:aminodeoxychorismate lyase n=1 Tax=Acinetobacter gerneri TaxID=202952 RepID=UPI003AF432D3
MICLKNAEPIQTLSILDRAFQYGDGFFSTARYQQNHLQLKSLHMARISDTSRRLQLKFDLKLLEKSFDYLHQQFPILNGTLKILVSRGIGERGYAMPDHDADLYCYFYPQADVTAQVEIIDSGVLDQAIGLCMPNLVGIKSLNRLEQVLLKQEANEKKWLEALVTDVQGGIVEGVSSNCFIKINNEWITPDLRYNGVHGVMRAEILARMNQANIACTPRFMGIEEIQQIQSLFFCNALSPMKAVRQLGNRALEVEPCIQLFDTLHLDQLSHHADSKT